MPVSAGAAPAGRTLGKYTLLGRLAQGGMGEILLARLDGAAGFEKYVVIKRLRPHLDDDEGSVQAFLDEARIVARISHPNVCQVHELGIEDGRYYLAMEYLEGLSLSGLIRRANRDRTPLDLRAVSGLIEQACEGLHHVHTLRRIDGSPASVLHRDVSPQNLFVTVDGAIKVLDFGIAKSGDSSVKTPTGRIKGKSAYMSPEQIRGKPLDPRSDIYSLGVVLYEAVTGQPLFQRGDVAETFRAIREDTLPFLRDVPNELNAVIQRAVAREREERFESARAFGRAVGEAVSDLGGAMSPPQVAEWLAQRFPDDLRERRERVARASTSGRAATVESERDRLEPGTVLIANSATTGNTAGPSGNRMAPTGSTMAPTGSTMALTAPSDELWTVSDPSQPIRMDSLPLLLPPRRRWRAWWTAAAVLVAAATIAAWAASTRSPPAVEGGLAASPALSATPAPAAFSDSDPDSEPEPGSRTGSGTGPESRTGPESGTGAESGTGLESGTGAESGMGSESGTGSGADSGTGSKSGTGSESGTGSGAESGTGSGTGSRSGSESDPDPGPRADASARSGRTPRRAARESRLPRGFFTVDSMPYATIFVDGVNRGVTPLLRLPLAPGTHAVVAVTADGRRRSFRVKIEPGEEAPRRRLVW